MSLLTTHVLDTARGAPAAGIAIELFAVDRADGSEGARPPSEPVLLARAMTNGDGRTDAPLGTGLAAGTYELVFDAGAYFAARATPAFYSKIAVRFIVDGAAHYHVPLLLSPWAYSTYRGS